MSVARTLALHLSKTVLYRIAAVALLLGGLAIALDLVESAARVLERDDGGILRYLGLRVPIIFAVVAPVALIVGPVLAFLSLSGRSEFTILRAAGATTYRLLALVAPLAFLLGVGLFFLNDRVVPTMEGRLLSWLDDEPSASRGDFWARTPTGVVRAESSSQKGDAISGVEIYEMDEAGRLISRISAAAATHEAGGWRLEDATRLIPGESASTRVDGALWETALRPANVRALATPGRTVAGNAASRILTGDWSGNRTEEFYQVRVYRGWSAFLTPFLMILLAAPAMFGSRRAGGMGGRAALAVALGFGFLLFDGMLTALGETGNLPPMLAAFGATVMFAAIGLYSLISLEE